MSNGIGARHNILLFPIRAQVANDEVQINANNIIHLAPFRVRRLADSCSAGDGKVVSGWRTQSR
jgi:hypothetical protein